MNLYTIGFTKKTAEDFFEALKKNGIKKIIDIRLNNKSQLAGFTKIPDFEYFLKLIGVEYEYYPEFAPDKKLLEDYRKKIINWNEYEKRYIELLNEREILNKVKNINFADCCLLCSEAEPDKCHRRLLAEYIAKKLERVNIIHIK
jgi:uncharacterized protein (DUF488 family)